MDNDDDGQAKNLDYIVAEQLLSLSAGVILGGGGGGGGSGGAARRTITQDNTLGTKTANLPTKSASQREQLAPVEPIKDLRAFRMNDRSKPQDYTTQLTPDGLIDLSMRRDKSDEHLNKISVPNSVNPVDGKKIIKHKLPVVPPPERENFKIMKTTEKRNAIVQTDKLFLVTEEEQEILHFIKVNAITMTSLTRLVEKNDDINNNTKEKHTKHREPYKQTESVIVLDNNEEMQPPKVAENIESLAVKNSENNKNMIFKVFESLHNAKEKNKSEKENFSAILAKMEKNHNELMAVLENRNIMLSKKHNDVKETQTDSILFLKETFQNISTIGSHQNKRRQDQNQMMRNQTMQVHQETSNHQDFHQLHNGTHQHRVEETQQTNGPVGFYVQNRNHVERQPWLLQQIEYQQRQMLQETGIPHSVHQSAALARNPVQTFQDIELRRVAMDRTHNYPNSAWTKSARE